LNTPVGPAHGGLVVQEEAHQGRAPLPVGDASERIGQGLAQLRPAGQGLLDDHRLVHLAVHQEEQEGPGVQVGHGGGRPGSGTGRLWRSRAGTAGQGDEKGGGEEAAHERRW